MVPTNQSCSPKSVVKLMILKGPSTTVLRSKDTELPFQTLQAWHVVPPSGGLELRIISNP